MATKDAQDAAAKKAAEDLAEKNRIAEEKKRLREIETATAFRENNDWKKLSAYLVVAIIFVILVLIQLTPDVCTSCEDKLREANLTSTAIPTVDVTQDATAEATSSVVVPPLKASPEATETATPSSLIDPDADFRPHTYTIILLPVQLSKESRLALLALLIGALGGLVHSLRSLSDYVGSRGFKNQWTLSYALRPFVSGGLALIVYLLVRGGLFPNILDSGDKYKLLAISGLIGLFSEQTLTKLRQLASAILSFPEQKPDPLPKKDTDSTEETKSASNENT